MEALRALVEDLRVTAYWKGRTETFEQDVLVTVEEGNRWNGPGDPTIYLTGDPGLALVEAGRHEPGGPSLEAIEGVVWSMEVHAPDVLDLRPEDVRSALGLSDCYWFLDRPACQQLIRSLRDSGICAGIVTQSAGLPDVTDRWNLVIFADRLSRPLGEVIRRPRRVGSFRIGLEDGRPAEGLAEPQVMGLADR